MKTKKKVKSEYFEENSNIFLTFLAPGVTFFFFWLHDFVAAVIPKLTFSKTEKQKNDISPCSADRKIGNFTKIKNAVNGFSL